MDAGTRQKRVEGLEAIKSKALQMAVDGSTDGELENLQKMVKKNQHLTFQMKMHSKKL